MRNDEIKKPITEQNFHNFGCAQVVSFLLNIYNFFDM